MKQLTAILLLSLLFVSCSKDDDKITQEFQLHGDGAEIPSLYFWEEGQDPIISGTAKGRYEIEIKASETESEISGIFHLCYMKVGRFYEKDIISKNFILKSGETIVFSDNFSFYGDVFDKASILIDVKTTSDNKLTQCPAYIVKSNVTILPK